jgi:hypothetical protein
MASMTLEPVVVAPPEIIITQKEPATVSIDAALDAVEQLDRPQSILLTIARTDVVAATERFVQVAEETVASTTVAVAPTVKAKKEKKSKENKQKPHPKVAESPFYQTLGLKLWTQSEHDTICTPTTNNAAESEVSSKRSKSKSSSSDLLSAPRPSMTHRQGGSNSEGYVSENSVSTGSMSDIQAKDPSVNSSLTGSLYNLDDFKRLEAITTLIEKYGSVSHMSVRDPSYSFWLNRTMTAAVHFKLLNKVAVLAGDPLCAPSAMPSVLEEFERYCRKSGWKTSIIGASEAMLEIAKLKKWPVMRFGKEKVLNPMTNEVLLGKGGKRIVTQCKQLIDPSKGGLSVNVYLPMKGRDLELEAELTKIYDDWRGDRNTSRDNQAFITVFEMFAMPNLMTFIYTRNKEGVINGFAALRKMGASGAGRYHIDPFIQSASAPRGTSDLLIFASLAYLNTLGASYMGLGHEPVKEPDAIYNMSSLIVTATRRVYRHIFGRLPVGGKEAFNSRWKPDSDQEAGLYLIFIGRKTPSPKHLLAMTHFANISLRNVLKADWKDFKQELRVPVASPDLMLYAGAAATVKAPSGYRPGLASSDPSKSADEDRPKLGKSASAPASATA